MKPAWIRGIVHGLIGFFAGAAGVSEYDLGYEACRREILDAVKKMERIK